ncbi:hypothetical protein ABZT17_33005 [Streptomyces sp. NPDC005648]
MLTTTALAVPPALRAARRRGPAAGATDETALDGTTTPAGDTV